MLPRNRRRALLPRCRIAALLLAAVANLAVGADESGIEVQVDVDDGVVRVATSYFVEAGPHEVWAVLIDFDNMPRFVRSVKSCAVVARQDGRVTIAQRGEAAYGPLKVPFESIRELRLYPEHRIESRMLSGTMSSYQGTTDLSSEGVGTRVKHRSESVPRQWVPPIIGPRFIVHETREQIAEFRAEVMRRKDMATR